MEINPITGIRAVSAVKSPKNEPQLSAVFDIESAFGPRQDTLAQNEGKMTGGQDDETAEPEETGESIADTAPGSSDSTVNFFA
jgi:hypothetical protein